MIPSQMLTGALRGMRDSATSDHRFSRIAAPWSALKVLGCLIWLSPACARPANEFPYYSMSPMYALPADVPSASLFSVAVHDAPTTATIGQEHLFLDVEVHYRGKGVCWQIHGDDTDRIVVDCLSLQDCPTSGSLSILRRETDAQRNSDYQPIFVVGLEFVRGIVFSGPDYPGDVVREEFVSRAFGTPSRSNLTDEEKPRVQEMLASMASDRARQFVFAGTSYKERLDLCSYFKLTSRGVHEFRIVFFIYPDITWRDWTAPLTRREAVYSEPFRITVE